MKNRICILRNYTKTGWDKLCIISGRNFLQVHIRYVKKEEVSSLMSYLDSLSMREIVKLFEKVERNCLLGTALKTSKTDKGYCFTAGSYSFETLLSNETYEYEKLNLNLLFEEMINKEFQELLLEKMKRSGAVVDSIKVESKKIRFIKKGISEEIDLKKFFKKFLELKKGEEIKGNLEEISLLRVLVKIGDPRVYICAVDNGDS